MVEGSLVSVTPRTKPSRVPSRVSSHIALRSMRNDEIEGDQHSTNPMAE